MRVVLLGVEPALLRQPVILHHQPVRTGLLRHPPDGAVGPPVGAPPLGAFVATSVVTVIVSLMHARGFDVGKLLPKLGGGPDAQ